MEKKFAIDLFKTFLTLKNPILKKGRNTNGEIETYRVSDSQHEVLIFLSCGCTFGISVFSGGQLLADIATINDSEALELMGLWEKAVEEKSHSKTSDHFCDAMEYVLRGYLNGIPPFPKGGHSSDEPECIINPKITIKELDETLIKVEEAVKNKKRMDTLDKIAENLKELEKLIYKI